ncbi:hypothetical protein SDC9_67197 [bioreactor metagenome]|uniref:Bro-N domain-containing protein n=1 Tax=bioreactor metagenome TaxID=1076179 RepID=A0A644XYP9_9ZZZZ
MSDEIIKSGDTLSFEDFKNQNGITFWWASDLMMMLGYPNMKSFEKVISRATKALMSLDIPHYENIIPANNIVKDELITDFKLTRFACYITVMNGDPKKQQVAEAQAYFATQTRQFELFIANGDDLERLLIRDEIKEGTKSLNAIAQNAGVSDFARFTNAGYLGMYNMESWRLENLRGAKKGSLMDRMGRTELAANLFRITQTEERIKSQNVRGQMRLEDTHFEVGREVRKMVEKNTNKTPEQLPLEKEIPDVKKELKTGYKKMLKEDNNKVKRVRRK